MIAVKLEFAAPEFFSLPPKALRVEESPVTGRTYFINRGRIVAVAKEDDHEDRTQGAAS